MYPICLFYTECEYCKYVIMYRVDNCLMIVIVKLIPPCRYVNIMLEQLLLTLFIIMVLSRDTFIALCESLILK